MLVFPEPNGTDDLRELLLDYLDYYRGVVREKAAGLTMSRLTASPVPSGWTITGLVNHLVHMERRWLHWGFAAERVDQPWADRAEDEGWVAPDRPLEELLADLDAVGHHSREIVQKHALTDLAAVGGRFASEAEAPQLQWILLHVLQEYARHAGHLDVGRELIDGAVGELG